MKRYIELSQNAGYEAGNRCRREKIAGRLELLKAFFDGEPFWMVRLRALTEADRQALNIVGNGHWRFVRKKEAEAKFKELAGHPKMAADALKALKSREAQRERVLAMIRDGKMAKFKKIAAKPPLIADHEEIQAAQDRARSDAIDAKQNEET